MLITLAALAAALHTMSAGIHLFGVAALNPTWHDLDGPAYVLVKQAADRRFPGLMRPFTLLGLGAVVALAVVAADRARAAGGGAGSGGCGRRGGGPGGRRPG